MRSGFFELKWAAVSRANPFGGYRTVNEGFSELYLTAQQLGMAMTSRGRDHSYINAIDYASRQKYSFQKPHLNTAPFS